MLTAKFYASSSIRCCVVDAINVSGSFW